MISYQGVFMPLKYTNSLFSFTLHEVLQDIYEKEVNEIFSSKNIHYFNIASNEFGTLQKSETVHLAIAMSLAYNMQTKKIWYKQWSGYLESEIPEDVANVFQKQLKLSSKYSALVWCAYENKTIFCPEMCALLISKMLKYSKDTLALIGFEILQ